jgi:hypothetical protein
MKPLYIFDLDGTIALNEHRAHLIEFRDCPKCQGHGVWDGEGCKDCEGTGRLKPDWDAFFLACVNDEPNWPVLSVMLSLLNQGADVQIWSGRGAIAMNETITWLQRYIDADVFADVNLVMRRVGDFTPDNELKESWYRNELTETDRKRLVCVFEDRDSVVAMWRGLGVPCFQVAPGDF